MNLRTFIRVSRFTDKMRVVICSLLLLSLCPVARAEWKIDLSRRRKEVERQELKAPMASGKVGHRGFLTKIFAPSTPADDVVILNTDKGFVPATIRLMKGMKYKIHVVNINPDNKNVSFILDAFSEHHATYYGRVSSFEIQPQREGVYSFECPETAIEGRVVVYQGQQQTPVSMRRPASE